MAKFIAQYHAGPQYFDAANIEDAFEQAMTLGRALYSGPHADPLSVHYIGPEHQPAPKGGRLPRAVRSLLVEATKAANRERCAVDQDAQEAMRLYLDTWVTTRLREILRWDAGEISTRMLDNNHGY